MNIEFGTRLDFERGVPGIYRNIPESVYHKAPYCSGSQMQLMDEDCPEAVQYNREHPSVKSDATKLGALIHAYMLRPDDFSLNYAVFAGERRSNVKKEEWADLVSSYGDNYVVREKDVATAKEMQEALMSRPFARKLFEAPGERELSILWIHKPTGLLVKCRYDILTHEGPMILDVKSSRGASRVSFKKSVGNYKYDCQAAIYLKAAEYHGLDVANIGFIPVEKKGRYASAYYLLTDTAIENGWLALQPMFDRWSVCQKSGIWSGHPERFQTLDVDNWRTYQILNADYEAEEDYA